MWAKLAVFTTRTGSGNRTANWPSRENVRRVGDNRGKPSPLSPVRLTVRSEGPQSAANRTESSNLDKFSFYIKGLLAERVGFEPAVRNDF